MTREEAITLIKSALKTMYLPKSKEYISDFGYALEIAIKALEREQQKYTRPRHCDCCGVLLTEENNKCGYELCDEYNERLEQSMERSRNEKADISNRPS